MLFILGIVVVLGSVISGYLLSHGKLLALWQPYELLIICGAALGAFMLSNPKAVIIATLKSIPKMIGGSRHNKALYMDLLNLLSDIFNKIRKDGLIGIEGDIDDPHNSPLFSTYPKLVKDHHLMDFICDYLRLMLLGSMNAFELENLMDVELETHHKEAALPAEALQKTSDALPGFGIVAAVMGIVITMGSLSGAAEELAVHVAAALVGTFLGILLAYGFVGPASGLLEHLAREEGKFYECVKVALLTSVNGSPPQVAVEFARKTLYSSERPSFQELEDRIRGK